MLVNVSRGWTTIALLTAALLFVGVTRPVTPAYSQDKITTIYCYKGNTEEGNYIGEFSLKYSLNNPVYYSNDCNHEYADCNGKCLGCYIDKNLKQVCYDEFGKRLGQKKTILNSRSPIREKP